MKLFCKKSFGAALKKAQRGFAISSFFVIFILFLMAAFVVAAFYFTGNDRRERWSKNMSIQNLTQLSISLTLYQSNKSSLPDGFAPVFALDEYNCTIGWFVPYARTAELYKLPTVDPVVLSVISPYRFAQLQNGNTLLFEIPGLWRDGTVHFVEVNSKGERQRSENENKTTAKELAQWLERELKKE